MKPRIRTKDAATPPAPRRLGRLGLVAALGAAVIALAAFWWFRPAPQPVHRGEGFNVLLISMDTTRPDHLTCYGRKDIQTPNIDRLAAEGALFEQCSTVTPLTLPSHSTMLTGAYPFVHGARINGHFTLHPDNETLAEVLKAAGYATGAEVAAFVLNREFGMGQGFDSYRDVQDAAKGVETPLGDLDTQRVGEDVATSAIHWLRANAAKPFFLFVHFYDPHQPYVPPPRFAKQYPNDPYLGEIAYTDEQIGRILAELKQLNLDRKTLVLLTSDHGEGLHDHGEETHGHLVYDATMHVPLILRCPEKIPAGVRIAPQVRLVDLAPTIMDFLGRPPLAHAQGASLLPLLEPRAKEAGRVAYGETLAPLYEYGYAPLRMLRADGWKYIHAPRPELYNITNDPGEKNNLAAQEPQRVAQMRETLRALIKDAPPAAGAGQARHALDERALAAVQSLGYGGSVAAAAARTELELLEPVGEYAGDRIEIINLTGKAISLGMTGRHADAERVFRDLLTRGGAAVEGLSLVHFNLGNTLAAQNKFADAIQHFKIALKNQPNDGMILTNLGEAYFKSGQTKEALDVFHVALQIKPVFARTHLTFGGALAADGKAEEALDQFRKALELDPSALSAYVNMGKLYARTNRLPEAVDAYNRALQKQPNQPRWRRELAEVLLQQNRPQEALQQLRTARQAAGQDAVKDPLLLAAFGRAHQVLGQADEAIVAYHAALRLQPRVPAWWEAEISLLLEQRRYKDAVDAARTATRINPNHGALALRLVWLLAACPDDSLRNGAEAVKLAEAVRDARKEPAPLALDALAAALAETGRFEEAVKTADEALRLAADKPEEKELVESIKARRELYQAQKPYRLTP